MVKQVEQNIHKLTLMADPKKEGITDNLTPLVAVIFKYITEYNDIHLFIYLFLFAKLLLASMIQLNKLL